MQRSFLLRPASYPPVADDKRFNPDLVVNRNRKRIDRYCSATDNLRPTIDDICFPLPYCLESGLIVRGAAKSAVKQCAARIFCINRLKFSQRRRRQRKRRFVQSKGEMEANRSNSNVWTPCTTHLLDCALANVYIYVWRDFLYFRKCLHFLFVTRISKVLEVVVFAIQKAQLKSLTYLWKNWWYVVIGLTTRSSSSLNLIFASLIHVGIHE